SLMMFLAVDIGNTGTKFGLFKKDEPFAMTFRFPTSQITAHEHIEDELLPKLAALGDLSSILIASVVPKATDALTKIFQRSHNEAKLSIVGHEDIPFINKYKNPCEAGIDRLLASFAAYSKWGKDLKKPVIVISFGTATTFDCITAGGEYLGGAIALGVEASAKHLHEIAAQLPEVDLVFPKKILGTTTTESIQSGVMNGAVAMIEGLTEKLKREVFGKEEVIVVAAGGLANLFEGRTTVINHIAPHLVLEGIAITAQSVGAGL
ncbi:MAG: type III pantothenate kinase, partial [Candidatus Kapaibacterium sp.]